MARTPDNPQKCPYLVADIYCFTKSIDHSYDEGIIDRLEDMWVECPFISGSGQERICPHHNV